MISVLSGNCLIFLTSNLELKTVQFFGSIVYYENNKNDICNQITEIIGRIHGYILVRLFNLEIGFINSVTNVYQPIILNFFAKCTEFYQYEWMGKSINLVVMFTDKNIFFDNAANFILYTIEPIHISKPIEFNISETEIIHNVKIDTVHHKMIVFTNSNTIIYNLNNLNDCKKIPEALICESYSNAYYMKNYYFFTTCNSFCIYNKEFINTKIVIACDIINIKLSNNIIYVHGTVNNRCGIFCIEIVDINYNNDSGISYVIDDDCKKKIIYRECYPASLQSKFYTSCTNKQPCSGGCSCRLKYSILVTDNQIEFYDMYNKSISCVIFI